MMEKPEDVGKATFEEVLQWCKTHLPYRNENDMEIWTKIVEICHKRGYEVPMTWDELVERCEDYR